MTAAAAQVIPVLLPRETSQAQQRELAAAPVTPTIESRNTSRCEDAVSLSLVFGIAAAGIGGLAAAGYFLFSEVMRLGLQTSFQSIMGVTY